MKDIGDLSIWLFPDDSKKVTLKTDKGYKEIGQDGYVYILAWPSRIDFAKDKGYFRLPGGKDIHISSENPFELKKKPDFVPNGAELGKDLIVLRLDLAGFIQGMWHAKKKVYIKDMGFDNKNNTRNYAIQGGVQIPVEYIRKVIRHRDGSFYHYKLSRKSEVEKKEVAIQEMPLRARGLSFRVQRKLPYQRRAQFDDRVRYNPDEVENLLGVLYVDMHESTHAWFSMLEASERSQILRLFTEDKARWVDIKRDFYKSCPPSEEEISMLKAHSLYRKDIDTVDEEILDKITLLLNPDWQRKPEYLDLFVLDELLALYNGYQVLSDASKAQDEYTTERFTQDLREEYGELTPLIERISEIIDTNRELFEFLNFNDVINYTEQNFNPAIHNKGLSAISMGLKKHHRHREGGALLPSLNIGKDASSAIKLVDVSNIKIIVLGLILVPTILFGNTPDTNTAKLIAQAGQQILEPALQLSIVLAIFYALKPFLEWLRGLHSAIKDKNKDSKIVPLLMPSLLIGIIFGIGYLVSHTFANVSAFYMKYYIYLSAGVFLLFKFFRSPVIKFLKQLRLEILGFIAFASPLVISLYKLIVTVKTKGPLAIEAIKNNSTEIINAVSVIILSAIGGGLIYVTHKNWHKEWMKELRHRIAVIAESLVKLVFYFLKLLSKNSALSKLAYKYHRYKIVEKLRGDCPLKLHIDIPWWSPDSCYPSTYLTGIEKDLQNLRDYYFKNMHLEKSSQIKIALKYLEKKRRDAKIIDWSIIAFLSLAVVSPALFLQVFSIGISAYLSLKLYNLFKGKTKIGPQRSINKPVLAAIFFLVLLFTPLVCQGAELVAKNINATGLSNLLPYLTVIVISGIFVTSKRLFLGTVRDAKQKLSLWWEQFFDWFKNHHLKLSNRVKYTRESWAEIKKENISLFLKIGLVLLAVTLASIETFSTKEMSKRLGSFSFSGIISGGTAFVTYLILKIVKKIGPPVLLIKLFGKELLQKAINKREKGIATYCLLVFLSWVVLTFLICLPINKLGIVMFALSGGVLGHLFGTVFGGLYLRKSKDVKINDNEVRPFSTAKILGMAISFISAFRFVIFGPYKPPSFPPSNATFNWLTKWPAVAILFGAALIIGLGTFFKQIGRAHV